jgi:hypothetical protein
MLIMRHACCYEHIRNLQEIMNILKTTCTILAIGALSLTVSSQTAWALTTQATINYGSRHSGNGGEFNISSTDFDPTAMGYAGAAISGSGFETFCLETNEYFTPGSTYYYAISQGASNGGASGGNPDPISLGTAWLYLNFAHGTLAGYDYTTGAGGNASAAALQSTLWWLEGEGANPGNAFSTLVMALPNYSDNNDGFYGVGVLNLWGDSNHTQSAQDQLILLQVPEGGSTAILLGFGLVALCLGGRKLQRVS